MGERACGLGLRSNSHSSWVVQIANAYPSYLGIAASVSSAACSSLEKPAPSRLRNADLANELVPLISPSLSPSRPAHSS